MKAKVLLLTTLLMALCFVSQAKEEVRIGAILPLTGEYDWAGEATRNGMLMCLEDHPSTKYNYKLIFEDCAMVPSKASLAAQKLANVDHVDMLMSMWGTECAAVMPISEAKKIPHMANEWDRERTEKSPHTVCLTCPPEYYAQMQMQMCKKWGAKRIALIYENVEDWKPAYAPLMQALKDNPDMKLVAEEKFNPPLRDFRTILSKIKEANPDVVLSWAMLPESQIILSQAKQLGLNCRFTGYFEDIADKSLVEGATFVRVNIATPDFELRYKRRFGQEALGVSAQGYDQMEAVVRSYEANDKKPAGQEFIESFAKLKPWQGTCGYLTPKGRYLETGMRVDKFQKGVMVPDPDFAELNKKMGW